MTEEELLRFMDRTGEFHERVASILREIDPVPESRFVLAFRAALLSIEHSVGSLLLVNQGLCSAGYALLRPQFESVVRGIWLLHAASDGWVDKLASVLSVDHPKSANEGLGVAEMIKQLESESSSAPRGLIEQLKDFKDLTWKPLNSYTHGGIHPLSRAASGYPPKLSYDVLRNSNALVTIASQLAAILSGRPENMQPIRALHADFADCLPIVS